MHILLLNAGSSSLKSTLIDAEEEKVLADSLAEWAGAVTHYQFTRPDGREHSEDVSWRGHAQAVQRVLHDLMHAEPAALAERSTLAAVGHRVVHGGPYTSSVRITPLDGLMMGTRSGSIDPGIILFVQRHHGLTAEQVETALNHESGLLGVSGMSGDMREILEAARAGHPQARLALDVYTREVRHSIGGLTATLGGVDALVFTAGVGEHSAEVREAVCTNLECLGLELDRHANAACKPDADVARPSSRGRILVIDAREDLTMLREVLQVLDGSAEALTR